MEHEFERTDDLLTAFAQQRRVLLRHTVECLGDEAGIVRPDNGAQRDKLSGILVASLEELKVAEEELLERTKRLADLRDELEHQVHAARELFDLSPAYLLVTDRYGSILETNEATAAFFRRPAAQLERQPLPRFIPMDDRRSFRDGLARIAETEGVSDWKFELLRPTDSAQFVSAAVRVVKSHEAPGTRLFWSLRVCEKDHVV